jgi:hypothetical protein
MSDGTRSTRQLVLASRLCRIQDLSYSVKAHLLQKLSSFVTTLLLFALLINPADGRSPFGSHVLPPPCSQSAKWANSARQFGVLDCNTTELQRHLLFLQKELEDWQNKTSGLPTLKTVNERYMAQLQARVRALNKVIGGRNKERKGLFRWIWELFLPQTVMNVNYEMLEVRIPTFCPRDVVASIPLSPSFLCCP